MIAAEVVLGVLVGLVVGLLGGGGAVLTVPALVLLLGLRAYEATTVSLVVVLVAAGVGVAGHARAGRVDWRPGAVIGALGAPGAILGARLAVLVDPAWLLASFGVLLLVSGTLMIRPWRVAGRQVGDDGRHPAVHDDATTVQRDAGRDRRGRHMRARLLLVAAVLGLLTGFLGVGGGFLAVPALVLLLGLPTIRAVGTSLLVVVVNSLVGLTARLGAEVAWDVALAVASGATVGTLAGVAVSGRLGGPALRRVFGVVVLTAGTVMLVTVLSGLG